MEPAHAIKIAAKVLQTVAALDSFPPPRTEATLQTWAAQIATTDYTLAELLNATGAVYARGKVPTNKLGAIFDEVRRVRNEHRRLSPIAQGVPQINPFAPRRHETPPVELSIICPKCGAQAGEYCVSGGRTRTLCHLVRIVALQKRVGAA